MGPDIATRERPLDPTSPMRLKMILLHLIKPPGVGLTHLTHPLITPRK